MDIFRPLRIGTQQRKPALQIQDRADSLVGRFIRSCSQIPLLLLTAKLAAGGDK